MRAATIGLDIATQVFQVRGVERRPVGFRTAFVYDVGQTHGKALPEFAKTTGDPSQFAAKLRFLVATEGISLEYDKSIEFSVLAHSIASVFA